MGCHFHQQTQLKTCLRDKLKGAHRLGCLVPSGGDPANVPWVQEEQDCPHGGQQHVGATGIDCPILNTNISWRLCNMPQTPWWRISQGKGLEEPPTPRCRNARTPQHTLHTHNASVLHRSASPWISRAVCWKAATASHLVTWFPSKQTGVQSPCPCQCTGAEKLSQHLPACFFRDGDFFSFFFFATFESCLRRCEANTYPGAPPGTFPAGEGKRRVAASFLAQKPAPGCQEGLLQGRDPQGPCCQGGFVSR